MKNVTLSLDDETYRQARIAAASRNQSLSGLVREYLQSLAGENLTPEDKAAALFSALDKAKGFTAHARLSREQVHERTRLR